MCLARAGGVPQAEEQHLFPIKEPVMNADVPTPRVAAAEGRPPRRRALPVLRGAADRLLGVVGAARFLGAVAAAGAVLAGGLAVAAPAGAVTAAANTPVANWAEPDPAASPPPGAGDSMAYDPATGQTILFTETPGGSAETWNWNGSTWTQLDPATSPSARTEATMAYDPALGGLVLFGGGGVAGFDNDTWLWNGTTWTQLDPATSPTGRVEAAMAYDPATSQLVLFGGVNGGTRLDDTWAFNGTTWTQLDPASSPSALESASMAYDPATNQLILFGPDTWSWNGATWTQLDPATSPPVQNAAAMSYDPATSQLILFGGLGLDGYDSGTWSWTGSTWTQLDPATSPAARANAAMAFDGSTGLLVLFGGGDPAPLDDTWTYGPPQSAPVITSGTTATFTQDSPGYFAVTTTALPVPTFTEIGALPAGLSFSSAGVLSGTPDGVSGPFNLIITATNSLGTATQDLLLVVDQAPVITSLHSATFVAGFKSKFQVTAIVAYPAPTFTETGALPAGVTLSAAGLLSGAPAAGTEGTYPVVITASNAAGTGKQKFTLTVYE
jgi:hypothetical protein